MGTTDIKKAENDGKNVIFWCPIDGKGEDTVLAETTWWYYPGTTDICEFDIHLDENEDWGTGKEADRADVQSVVTHEAGHRLGLDDVKETEEIMYEKLAYGEIKHNLGEGDKAGIRFLYPLEPPYIPEFGAELPFITSIAVVACLFVRQQLGKRNKRTFLL